MQQEPPVRIGLIGDTHGLLRPRAMEFLRGCHLIIHGGDIGGEQVLLELGRIAPVTAVRGNNDTGPWAQALNETELLPVQSVCLYAIHNLADMTIDPKMRGVRVVISGHSHKPSIEERDGVLFVNPGSSGPRRFTLPIAIGDLNIQGSQVAARIVDLESDATLASSSQTR